MEAQRSQEEEEETEEVLVRRPSTRSPATVWGAELEERWWGDGPGHRAGR